MDQGGEVLEYSDDWAGTLITEVFHIKVALSLEPRGYDKKRAASKDGDTTVF